MTAGRARRAAVALALTWLALFWIGPAVQAQQLGLVQSPILTIESDRLFSDSAYGKRAARELEAESAVLAAENRRIEAELTAEERALTDQRAELEAEAFRVLADAFDEKVQGIRREQESKARDLAQRGELRRVEFFRSARPVLENLMQESGASVILERSSVFLSANVTDVTDLAITRIDRVLQDTPDQDPPDDDP